MLTPKVFCMRDTWKRTTYWKTSVFKYIPYLYLSIEQFATLESVKAVSECYTPVSGSVVESNESVTENPTMINKSPLADGKIQAQSPRLTCNMV